MPRQCLQLADFSPCCLSFCPLIQGRGFGRSPNAETQGLLRFGEGARRGRWVKVLAFASKKTAGLKGEPGATHLPETPSHLYLNPFVFSHPAPATERPTPVHPLEHTIVSYGYYLSICNLYTVLVVITKHRKPCSLRIRRGRKRSGRLGAVGAKPASKLLILRGLTSCAGHACAERPWLSSLVAAGGSRVLKGR